jgi:oligoribonuclease
MSARHILLDIETTGLDPDGDLLLEIAMTPLHGHDEEIDISKVFQRVAHYRELPDMEQVVVDMHTKNGLLEEVAKLGGKKIFEIEAEAIMWLDAQPGSLIAVGNSVHFDLSFLRTQMPALWTRFRHSILDVSTIRRWLADAGYPKVQVPHLAHEVEHRSLGDIQRCYRELRACESLIRVH